MIFSYFRFRPVVRTEGLRIAENENVIFFIFVFGDRLAPAWVTFRNVESTKYKLKILLRGRSTRSYVKSNEHAIQIFWWIISNSATDTMRFTENTHPQRQRTQSGHCCTVQTWHRGPSMPWPPLPQQRKTSSSWHDSTTTAEDLAPQHMPCPYSVWEWNWDGNYENAWRDAFLVNG